MHCCSKNFYLFFFIIGYAEHADLLRRLVGHLIGRDCITDGKTLSPAIDDTHRALLCSLTSSVTLWGALETFDLGVC
jgi:hypothetical protein